MAERRVPWKWRMRSSANGKREIERGGEVALEQFWIQKSFCPELNIRVGHDIVPIGYTNAHHTPNEFFTVYRPEGESQIASLHMASDRNLGLGTLEVFALSAYAPSWG